MRNSASAFGRLRRLLGVLALVVIVATPASCEDSRPLILAHYMPWYVAKPHSEVWGWHWTMNHFDPEMKTGERRQIASHFYPLIGPYDSGDPHVIEYHLLTMKLAGIDGVIVDWYGLTDFRDYAILHRNTTALVKAAERLGMRFAICYEDRTIPTLVDAKRLKKEDRIRHASQELKWLANNWFKSDAYVRLDRKPILLSFGQANLSDAEWSACLKNQPTPIAYFSEHYRRTAALGAFDWPVPTEGLAANDRFIDRSEKWPNAVPVAFPRFVDIYKEARVHDSFGRIEDGDGATFRDSLRSALRAKPKIVQVATWNDWGEGTQIEPSLEHGYRDLEVLLQTARPQQGNRPNSASLRLPHQLLRTRRLYPRQSAACDRIAADLAAGKTASAKRQLSHIATLPQR